LVRELDLRDAVHLLCFSIQRRVIRGEINAA